LIDGECSKDEDILKLKKLRGNLFLALYLLLLSVLTAQQSTDYTARPLQDLLRSRIEAAGVPPQIYVGKEPIYAKATLIRLYERRIFQPIWINESGLQ
jgi:hypothetical protein